MRFGQPQVGQQQQQQFQQAMSMGPPSSFAHPQQMQQSQQGQPGDMNVYSVGMNMVSQQPGQQLRMPMGSQNGLLNSNSVRPPTWVSLSVKSPQAQPSPNMGRQSTPGPGFSPLSEDCPAQRCVLLPAMICTPATTCCKMQQWAIT